MRLLKNNLSTVDTPVFSRLISSKSKRSISFLSFKNNSSLGTEYKININTNENNNFYLKELKKYKLKSGEFITLQQSFEDNLFYLTSEDLNLYSYGKTLSKCISMMQEEVENL